MVNLPMLWTSLRLNWGNTLAVTAFCLLSVLGAISHVLVSNDRDDAGPGKTEIGTSYTDVAPPMTAPLQQVVSAD